MPKPFGTWRPESHRKEAVDNNAGTWVVYLDTGITITQVADPDSNEFRALAREKFLRMLETDQFDLSTELEEL